MKALCTLLSCAVLVGGCGGAEKPKLDRLPDGRAEGAGYAFELSKQWRALQSTEEVRRELTDSVAGEVPGLDVQAGLLFTGFWVQPGEDELRPTVNVVAEPVTADTTLDTLAASEVSLIKAKATTRPATLGGDPAVRYAYQDTDDSDRKVETRGVVVKRGDLAYVLTVQMTGPRAPGKVDELTDQLSSSWTWREPDAGQRKDLTGLSEFEGTGYELTLPPGWRGTGKEALADSGQAGLDAVWRGWIGPRFATNVNVAQVDFPATDLALALREVARAERKSDAAAPALEIAAINQVDVNQAVDGEPTGALELTSTINRAAVRNLEVVTLHDSKLYRLTLSSLRGRYPAERRTFLRALRTWRWR